MTPAEARQALLDALTVERFTTFRPERPALTVEGQGRPSATTLDELQAAREIQARRARLRVASA